VVEKQRIKTSNRLRRASGQDSFIVHHPLQTKD
jgi:hypothetical protein